MRGGDAEGRSSNRGVAGWDWVRHVALLAGLSLAGSAAAQNIVSNGGFELPVVPGSLVTYWSGNMSGWTLGGGGIDLIGAAWRAAAGNQSLDLNSASAGSVYQMLSTVTNQTYRLRFALAGNPGGYAPKQMEVRWGGVAVTNVTFPWSATSSGTNMGWVYHSLVVTATGPNTRLDFVSLTGAMPGSMGTLAFYGPALDDVSVVPYERYALDWWTVDGGGDTSGGDRYTVSGTIGQPDAGETMTNGQYSLTGGFWVLPVAVPVAGAPTLTIAPAASGLAFLSWTPNTPGYVLQEALNLSSPSWSNAPSGSSNPTLVPVTTPAKFYRLFKP